MPRPRKFRNVCQFPGSLSFIPGEGTGEEPIVMTVDEYETLRLIDYEGLSQEQCGDRMAIARTTVQQIYASARRNSRSMPPPGGSSPPCWWRADRLPSAAAM